MESIGERRMTDKLDRTPHALAAGEKDTRATERVLRKCMQIRSRDSEVPQRHRFKPAFITDR
jgi:hypothetical protein